MCLTRKQVHGLTAAIFTVVALLHAARLLMNWAVTIEGYVVPYWFSILGVIVAGYLAYELWQAYGERPARKK